MKVTVKTNGEKLSWVGLVLVMVIGIGLMVYGINMSIDNKKFYDNCERTRGILVDVWEGEDSDGDDIYKGIYQYAVDGVVYQVMEEDGSVFEPDEGEIVKIYYDPEHPSHAKTEFSDNDSATGMIVAGTGIIFTLVALAFVLGALGAKDVWMQFLMGVALMLMGFGMLIAVGLAALPAALFGIVGVYLVGKSCFVLIGRKKSADKLDRMADKVMEKVGPKILALNGALEENQRNGEEKNSPDGAK